MSTDVAISSADPAEAPHPSVTKLYGTDLVRQQGLFALLKEDFIRHGRSLDSPGLWALVIYRFGTWSRGVHIPGIRLLLRILYRLAHIFVRNFCGIELRDTIKIGRRLLIGHQSGIVIHECATIGDDCIIRQNVTFGAGTEWTPGKGPVIGDRVTFGVGTVVVGNVTIGSDVNIGPNCTISTDIPSNRTVFVPPPRVLPREADKGPDAKIV